MKKSLIIILLFSYTTILAQQGIGISTTGANPDSSAILDVASNSKGMLVPRMTETERNAIVNPALGLLIFNVTNQCFNFYKNNGWYELCGNCVTPPSPTPSGNSPLCSGSTLNLTSTTIPGATYFWTGPYGFTSSLQNPSLSNVKKYNAGVYSVYVSVNGCSSSVSNTNIVIDSLPNQPGAITGSSCVAAGSTGIGYSISPVAGASSYIWTVPAGASITSGQSSTSISVDFGATPGNVCVSASNYCGTGTSKCMPVKMACSAINNWQYKVPVTINNSANSSSITDYQVNVVINTSALISAGKMRADGADIRFTDSDSCTFINFWIEKGLNTSSTSIWVKVPNIPANSTKKIYLYYGNSSASDIQSGDNTFMFFDDFNGIANGNPPNSSKWNSSASTTIQNAKMRVKGSVVGKQAIGTNNIIEANLYAYASSGNEDFRIDVMLSSSGTCATFDKYIQNLLPWEGGDTRADYFDVNCNYGGHIVNGGPKYTNYDLRLTTYVSGGTTYFNAYNISNSTTLYNSSTTWKTTGNYVQLGTPNDTRYTDVENFRVRKYSSFVPAISNGSESGICQ